MAKGRDQSGVGWVSPGSSGMKRVCRYSGRIIKDEVGSWEALLRTRGDKPTRHLYVIQLDPQVYQDSRAFREKNPDYRAQQLCLYVGTTVLSPEERFAQHQAGTKANRYAKKYGLKLLPDLHQNHPRLTANNYAEREESYANELRLQGHAVWQN